jgi:glyoxylase-like metal-dependent hydrolase (beta-lactamase superfamily II)
MNHKYSRRRALHLLGLGAAASTFRLRQASAADSGPPNRSNPRYYRFNVGDFQLTVFNDGYKLFQPVQPFWANEASPSELGSTLANAFLPTDHIIAYFNVLLIDTGKDVLLCDSGFGRLSPVTAGQLAAQLPIAGYRPDQITAVFLSHAHWDHFGGLLSSDGKPVFGSAQHFISTPEWNFWTQQDPDLSQTLLSGEDRNKFRHNAQETLSVLESKLQKFEPGTNLIEGVTTRLAPGHTPGHTILHIQSGHEEFVHIVDLAHHYILMFQHPAWTIGIDTVPSDAVSTRKQIFTELAATRTRVIGYHLPFPGIGHIRANGDAFEWVPEPWRQV